MIPQKAEVTKQDISSTQDAARVALGLMLMATGTSHLTVARDEFKAQVPTWVPLGADTVVLQSGFVEIALGGALVFLPQRKALLGRIAAAFLTCIFPGNIAQYTHRRNAFGLNTDRKRFVRLFFQPALIAWALWSTGTLRIDVSARNSHGGSAPPPNSLNAHAQRKRPSAIG
jgi:uncharacterized membrane protein